jgi:hypothetical protein
MTSPRNEPVSSSSSNRAHLRYALVGACLLSAGLSVAAAERAHFDSQRRDGAITVDGKFDDWYGNLAEFSDQPVSIQVLNDGEFLYLRLTASDAGARAQIMRRGMTVWFDPQGGTKKKIGVRYPVVEHGESDDAGRGRGAGGYGGGGHGHARGEQPEGTTEDTMSPTDRVDILGPGKDDARSLTRDHLSGVDVAMRTEEGTLRYELKIPLVRTADHPYAIETQTGKTIGLGLETPKPEQHAMPSGGRGGGGGFGGGGGMGGHGGGGMGRGGGGGGSHGGGGGGGNGSYQAPTPLKGWATVTIAPVQ